MEPAPEMLERFCIPGYRGHDSRFRLRCQCGPTQLRYAHVAAAHANCAGVCCRRDTESESLKQIYARF